MKEPDDPAYWILREALVATINRILQDCKFFVISRGQAELITNRQS